MPVDTQSLLALALLVFAASVAAYLFSQRLGGSRDHSTLAQWAYGVGSVALLAAAVAYFLSVFSLTLSKHEFDEELIASASSRTNGFPHRSDSGPTNAARDKDPDDIPTRAGSNIDDETRRRAGSPGSLGTLAAKPGPARSNSAVDRLESARAAHLVRTLESQPWAATDCVFQIRPDPALPDLWWLENECDAPVGIVIAACAGATADCEAGRSRSWAYVESGMYLPAKAQRSVSYAEQSQRGSRIRFIACVITHRPSIDLLSTGPVARTQQWRETLSNASDSDACLSQVQRLSEIGTRTHAPIDDLLGASAPGRARQTRRRD